MRAAYVGLSIALALFIIAQGVKRQEILYALIIPAIILTYGVMAKETPPEVKVIDEENTDEPKDD